MLEEGLQIHLKHDQIAQELQDLYAQHNSTAVNERKSSVFQIIHSKNLTTNSCSIYMN